MCDHISTQFKFVLNLYSCSHLDRTEVYRQVNEAHMMETLRPQTIIIMWAIVRERSCEEKDIVP